MLSELLAKPYCYLRQKKICLNINIRSASVSVHNKCFYGIKKKIPRIITKTFSAHLENFNDTVYAVVQK